MRATIGRRAMFFGICSLVCLALVPATPAELRWVDLWTAGIGAVWTIVLALDEMLSPRERPSARRAPVREDQPMPFAPPPPPGGFQG
jgi:hypothetical protein